VEPEDERDAKTLAQPVHLGRGETAVTTDGDRDLGPFRTDGTEQPFEQRHRRSRTLRPAGLQHRRKQVAILVEDEEWQVDVFVVEP
jgi:hypothetical protein